MSAVDTAPNAVETTYISLMTRDHKVLKITSKAARQSGTLRTLTDDLGFEPGAMTTTDDIPVLKFDESTLKKVIEWCEHHKEDEETSGAVQRNPQMNSIVIPTWDSDFLKVNNGELFDLITAACFFDIEKLLDYACKTVADQARDKSPAELRAFFCINEQD